jgi:hypothetical protein
MSDAIATAAPVALDFWRSQSPAVAAIAGAAVVTVLSVLIDGLTSRIKIVRDNPWLLDLLRGSAIQAGRATQDAINKAGRK